VPTRSTYCQNHLTGSHGCSHFSICCISSGGSSKHGSVCSTGSSKHGAICSRESSHSSMIVHSCHMQALLHAASTAPGEPADQAFAFRQERTTHTMPSFHATTSNTSTGCINAYGANLTSALRSQLIFSSPYHSGANGAFLDSCTRHCTSAGPTWPPGTIGLQIGG
jgi:hypothetical protein